MADTSPTLEKQRKVTLDVYSVISESVSAIARDFVEYVKLKTGSDVSPTIQTPGADISPVTPTPEVDVKVQQKEKSKKSKNLLSKIFDMFSFGKISKILMGLGLVAAIGTVLWVNFKESFIQFFSNLWDKMKEGFSKIGEWFSNLFDKAGDLISGLWDSVVEFVQPFKDRIVEFFTSIGDYISEKFSSIMDFFGKFNIFGKKDKPKMSTPPPAPEIKKEDTLPTETKGVDEDGFEYTERRRAKKVVKTPEQIEYEKKRDAELEERSKKSREKFRKIKERKDREKAEKAKAGEPTPMAEVPTTKPEPVTPAPQEKPKKSTGKINESDDTKKMIMQHEGVVPYPYLDTKGYWTIGVGHLMNPQNKTTLPSGFEAYAKNRGPYDKGNNKTPALSDDEVKKLFNEDFDHHKKIAEKGPGFDQANEAAQGAFIDLSFNMGKWWTIFKNAAKKAAVGDFVGTAEELKDSKWFKQVGSRAVTVTNLIAQAGAGVDSGATIASSSNENAVNKRVATKGNAPNVINAPVTNNTNVVSKEVTYQKQKQNTDISLRAV